MATSSLAGAPFGVRLRHVSSASKHYVMTSPHPSAVHVNNVTLYTGTEEVGLKSPQNEHYYSSRSMDTDHRNVNKLGDNYLANKNEKYADQRRVMITTSTVVQFQTRGKDLATTNTVVQCQTLDKDPSPVFYHSLERVPHQSYPLDIRTDAGISSKVVSAGDTRSETVGKFCTNDKQSYLFTCNVNIPVTPASIDDTVVCDRENEQHTSGNNCKSKPNIDRSTTPKLGYPAIDRSKKPTCFGVPVKSGSLLDIRSGSDARHPRIHETPPLPIVVSDNDVRAGNSYVYSDVVKKLGCDGVVKATSYGALEVPNSIASNSTTTAGMILTSPEAGSRLSPRGHKPPVSTSLKPVLTGRINREVPVGNESEPVYDDVIGDTERNNRRNLKCDVSNGPVLISSSWTNSKLNIESAHSIITKNNGQDCVETSISNGHKKDVQFGEEVNTADFNEGYYEEAIPVKLDHQSAARLEDDATTTESVTVANGSGLRKLWKWNKKARDERNKESRTKLKFGTKPKVPGSKRWTFMPSISGSINRFFFTKTSHGRPDLTGTFQEDTSLSSTTVAEEVELDHNQHDNHDVNFIDDDEDWDDDWSDDDFDDTDPDEDIYANIDNYQSNVSEEMPTRIHNNNGSPAHSPLVSRPLVSSKELYMATDSPCAERLLTNREPASQIRHTAQESNVANCRLISIKNLPGDKLPPCRTPPSYEILERKVSAGQPGHVARDQVGLVTSSESTATKLAVVRSRRKLNRAKPVDKSLNIKLGRGELL